jgi:hypothetical protein
MLKLDAAGVAGRLARLTRRCRRLSEGIDMAGSRPIEVEQRSPSDGIGRRAVTKALGATAAGVVAVPGWSATIGQAAAKGTRAHPAIVALIAALDNAATELNVPVAEIVVQRLEAQEWPDGCLGLTESGEVCTEALVSGYRIVLQTADAEISYRTDQQGNVRREPAEMSQDALQIHLERTGGIAGRRDELDLNAANLTDAEASELRRLIEEADFWNLPEEIDEGTAITDGYEYVVTVSDGADSHTASIYGIASLDHSGNQGLWRLVSWLEERIGPA